MGENRTILYEKEWSLQVRISIYIDLVKLYGISTPGDYLMPDPVDTYK